LVLETQQSAMAIFAVVAGAAGGALHQAPVSSLTQRQPGPTLIPSRRKAMAPEVPGNTHKVRACVPCFFLSRSIHRAPGACVCSRQV